MNIKALKLISVVTITLLLCACSLLGADKLAEPKIEVKKVTIEKLGFTQTTLAFLLAVNNPNSVAFDLKELNYNLTVDGQKLSTGRQNFDRKIAATSVTEVKVPLVLENTQFFSTLGQIAKTKKTPYKITGTVKLGLLPIPFDEEGVLDTSDWFSGQ